jgi:hypothetical protein
VPHRQDAEDPVARGDLVDDVVGQQALDVDGPPRVRMCRRDGTVEELEPLERCFVRHVRDVERDAGFAHRADQLSSERRQRPRLPRVGGVPIRMPRRPDDPHAALHPERKIGGVGDRVRVLHQQHELNAVAVEVGARPRDRHGRVGCLPFLVDGQLRERGRPRLVRRPVHLLAGEPVIRRNDGDRREDDADPRPLPVGERQHALPAGLLVVFARPDLERGRAEVVAAVRDDVEREVLVPVDEQRLRG